MMNIPASCIATETPHQEKGVINLVGKMTHI